MITYNLSQEQWRQLRRRYCNSLVCESRVTLLKSIILQDFNLEYTENALSESDYGRVSGEPHFITWFLLNI